MMIYICTKFHENILNGFRVMERTRKVNGQTDGRRARHNTTRLRRAYKNEKKTGERKMSKQSPPAPTSSTIGPCPTIIQSQ